MQRRLSAEVFRSCIFKGQSVAALYPSNLSGLRQSSDVDIWIEGGKKREVELVRKIVPTKEVRETHAQLKAFSDTEVEAHYRPGLIRNFVKNAKLQRFFKEEACFLNRIKLGTEGLELCAPTSEFNLVHQLMYIYHHLFTEGVGLRQVMDYYFVLKDTKGLNGFNSLKVQRVVSELGLNRFASALMWVIGHVFEDLKSGAPETSSWLLWEPNEKDGRFLLNEIMEAETLARRISAITCVI